MRTPIGVVDERGITDVYGTGGSLRHSGAISKDNPYYSSLMMSSNNQDKDALYELAIQWEADNANLQEQREYDLPINQVQRQREAGINPDLTGSSGSNTGSGVGSGSSAHIADQTGQTKFKNQYDDTNTWFNGIATAGQFVSSVSGSISSLMSGISALRNSTSMGKLYDAQSNLVNAQADTVNALLDGSVEAQKLSNIDGFINNSARFSQILGKDFTDEQAAEIYSAAGISEDQFGGYNSAVRAIHERPDVASNWYRSKVGERYTKAQNQKYTEDYITQFVAREAEIQTDSQISQMYITLMDRKLNEILNYDPSYIDNKAETILQSAELNKEQANQAFLEFQNYCYGYGERIDHARDKIKQIDKDISPYVTFDSKGNIVSIKDDITPAERAFVDAAIDSRMLIKYGAANDFMLFSNVINRYGMQAYIKNEMVRDSGSLKTLNGRQKIVQFGEGMFQQTITGVRSGMDIATQAIQTVGSLASGFGAFGIGASALMKGVSALNQGVNVSTVTDYKAGSGGTWIPKTMKVSQNSNLPGYTGIIF